MTTTRATLKLRPKEAAELLGVKSSTLAKWRSRREGPPFERCGGKIIFYYVADLNDWLAAHKYLSHPVDKTPLPPQ